MVKEYHIKSTEQSSIIETMQIREEITRKFTSSFLYMIFLFAFGISIWLYLENPFALLMGIFGCFINFVVDYGLWFRLMKTRTIKGIKSPVLFFILFMVYGIFQFSYAIILFGNNLDQKIIFSILIFGGLFLIGEISRFFGSSIEISRYISPNHWFFRVIFVGIIYLILFFFIHNIILIFQLFLIGIIVEASLEIPLLLNRTRQFYWRQFILNLLFEFNLGIPILYALFHYFSY